MVKIKEKRSRATVIGKRLDERMRELNTTNKALGDFCGVSEQAVWKWRYTGKIGRDNINRICTFFAEPPSWLMDDFDGVRKVQKGAAPSSRALELANLIDSLPEEISREMERHIKNMAQAVTVKRK